MFIVLSCSFIYGRSVKLFNGEVWIMYSELGYQFRASHFPCFTHCFYHTNSQAQQDLYWITALLEGECAIAAHHKHFISIPCSLVVHLAANNFLPHCAGFFLLQGSRKLKHAAEVQTSQRCSPTSRLFSLALAQDGGVLWEVQRSSAQTHQGQQPVANTEERAPTARRKSLMVYQDLFLHAHGLQHHCK